ncbi:hypothetical protein A1356_23075 [Methylomonas koyamae]|uniref:Uncharacterized protein n=2 Tax=Methylomonas koyamae TaxID=702114 RepID=A0AA91I708_9GAMM|nr:hypothetical protein A1356_23075 [Methylomonas koyamae]
MDIVDNAQEAFSRSKALVSTALVLLQHDGGTQFMNGVDGFTFDRLVYQLEAAAMLLDEYQALFLDAEKRMRSGRNTSEKGLASAA